MKTVRIIMTFLFCLSVIFLTVSTTQPVNAELSSGDAAVFSQNNITGWNPGECIPSDDTTTTTASGNVSVCNANLPSETVKMLEDAGVKKKAQENMERYKHAEEKTGVAWQAIAALHWREGSMDPGSSISNGEPLSSGGCYTNIDGFQICSDPNEDAVAAAKSLLEDGRSVYNVDIVSNPGMDSYGYAFLAYNRGSMYKCNGNVSYDKSPYVMNYYDKDHWEMTWLNGADDTDCNGRILNNVGGSVNQQLGALTVLAYLCGEDSSASSSTKNSSSSSKASKSSSQKSSSGSKSSSSKSSSKAKAKSKSSSNSGNGLTKEQAQKIADYYNSSNVPNDASAGIPPQQSGCASAKENCVAFSAWFVNALTDVAEKGTNPTRGNGLDVAGNLAADYNLKSGKTPKPYAVFSNPSGTPVNGSSNHTGIVVGVDGNEVITIEAACGGWMGENDGLAHVFKYTMPQSGMLYAYLDGHLDNDAISKILGGEFDNGSSCTTYEGDYPQYTQETDHTCGPASMAMLATVAAGRDILESDVVNIIGDDNAYVNTVGSGMASLDQKVGDKYGFTVESVDVSGLANKDIAAKMKEYLNKGYMIHMSGCGPTISPTGGCHYTGMFKINGDKVLLADSAGGAYNNREVNLVEYVTSGYHGDAFSAIKGDGSSSGSCSADYGVNEPTICSDQNYSSDSGTLRSGGFTSVDEADKKVMDPYRTLSTSQEGEWDKYHITAGTPYNCFSFSNYFITKYTTIKDFYGVPGVDGGGYAEEFYNIYHEDYPEITLSSKPSPYSVAGCGSKYYAGDGSPSHTFIVLGVDATKNSMIYGEAAYGSGLGGINAGEIGLDSGDPYRVGSGCKYADFSKYVKGI